MINKASRLSFTRLKSIIMNIERSEHLYESLKMRGFSGKITFVKKKLRFWDFLLLSAFFLLMIFLIYFINLKQFYEEVFNLFLQ